MEKHTQQLLVLKIFPHSLTHEDTHDAHEKTIIHTYRAHSSVYEIGTKANGWDYDDIPLGNC